MAKKVAPVGHATLRDTIIGITGLIEDAKTASVTIEDRSGLARTENRLKAMPQDLKDAAVEEILDFVKLENSLICKIESVASSPRHQTRMAEITLDS